MQLPFFYISEYTGQKQIMLDEDTTRHVVQVLRMRPGEQLNLTDGKGNLLTCEISEAGKKLCIVEVKATTSYKPQARNISIAISLLKNTNRFEWFLEKATEIGVNEIIPLICERTEKEKFRFERLNGICISAMLQSQQKWLPVLHQPLEFSKAVTTATAQQKFIAHCDNTGKEIVRKVLPGGDDLGGASIILIGPEGDFTPGEIQLALQNAYVPVSLGETRLRTETAGVVAAALLCHI